MESKYCATVHYLNYLVFVSHVFTSAEITSNSWVACTADFSAMSVGSEKETLTSVSWISCLANAQKMMDWAVVASYVPSDFGSECRLYNSEALVHGNVVKNTTQGHTNCKILSHVEVPAGCPAEFVLVGSTCVLFVTSKYTWLAGSAYCQNQQAEYFSASSLEMFQDMKQHMTDSSYAADYWVGLHYTEELGWRWTGDLSAPRTEEWYSRDGVREPNGQSSRDYCARMSSKYDFQLGDKSCSYKYPIICQVKQ